MTSNDTSPFGGRLLIGATGSAAVASLPMYVNALRAVFTGTVTVLMTHTATTFLPPHTVGLFADRVVTGTTPADWARENQATLAAVDPPWGQRYDVGLGEFVKSPMPPAPPQFIDVIREFMPVLGTGRRRASCP